MPTSSTGLDGFSSSGSPDSSAITVDTPNDVAQNQQLQAIQQFQEAIHLIPDNLKADYLEAIRVAPEVVEKETLPLAFLRRDDFNTWKAAQRICMYWKQRRHLFKDRAFLPMNMSGNGTMTTSDVESFKCGSFQLLPNDNRGRPILLMDQNREASLDPETKMRKLFYMAQVFSRNVQAQTDGVVVIVCPDLQARRSLSSVIMDHIHSALPIRLSAVHVVFLQRHVNALLQAVVPYVLQRFGPQISSLTVIHSCNTLDQAAERLQVQGIHGEILPPFLGGTYAVDVFNFLAEEGADVPTRQEPLTAGPHISAAPLAASALPPLSPEYTSDEYQRAETALQEAISTTIPEADRVDYTEAMRRVPHLVRKESPPIRFLRVEKFNVWAAANRLVTYWRSRVSLFEERAFLPLSATGAGALTSEEVSILEDGYMSVLPNDSAGRSVFLYEPAKLRETSTTKSKLRMSFYLFSVMSENEISQTDGIVGLVAMSPSGFTVPDTHVRLSLNILLDAIPLVVHTSHIVYRPPQQQSIMGVVIPTILRSLDRIVDQSTHFHVADDMANLCSKLESVGISRKNVPELLGGELHESQGRQSFKARVQRESFAYQETMDTSSKDGKQGGASALGVPTLSLENAMQQIPDIDKQAFLEAAGKAPHLIEKESPPARFLAFSFGDGMAAARMLANYWKVRKEIFNERALLPMDQTGDGALDRRDVGALQSAYLIQAPNDAEGCSVLCCDGSRLQKSSRTSRFRCTFYYWSVISENCLSQTSGYCLLYSVTEPSFDRANKECLEQVLKAIPVKLKRIHIVGIPSKEVGGVDSYIDGPVKETREMLLSVFENKCVVNVENSRHSLLTSLERCGFARSGLPRSLGGLWGLEEFVQWQELRVRHEWELTIGAGSRETAEQYSIPANRSPAADTTEEEKTERKRRMNVIHSRRKRERERIEVEVLNDRVEEERELGERLREEGERLQALVNQAHQTVAEKE